MELELLLKNNKIISEITLGSKLSIKIKLFLKTSFSSVLNLNNPHLEEISEIRSFILFLLLN